MRELAAEAYRAVDPGPDPYNEAEAAWVGFGALERKFAELIVRECASLAYDGPGGILDHFGLEEQFGVEE
jgi:hypothetical protein